MKTTYVLPKENAKIVFQLQVLLLWVKILALIFVEKWKAASGLPTIQKRMLALHFQLVLKLYLKDVLNALVDK
jgi:hypothetical protein